MHKYLCQHPKMEYSILIAFGFLLLLAGFVIIIVVSLRRRRKSFEDHNIPYLGTNSIRIIQAMWGKIPMVQLEQEIYQTAIKYENSPIVGQTDLVVTDLNLMKSILVKDFDHFVNRRPFGGNKCLKSNLIFRKNLANMENEQWKGVRAKLSPMFTTGKIKRMFSIFQKSSESLTEYIANQNDNEVNISEMVSKYAMDVIASCAFAIDSKTWDVPLGKQSQFEQIAKHFELSFKPIMFVKLILVSVFPKLADWLELELFDSKAQKYFMDILLQTVKQRRQSGVSREDFLQMMIDAQAGLLNMNDKEINLVMNGILESDTNVPEERVSSVKSGVSKVTFDDLDILPNSVLFLVAGFQTTLSLLIFVLYALALEPEVQEKLYTEIYQEYEDNSGKLTYESVAKMKYLDMVINETLRLYTPNSRVERCCTRDYLVPGTTFTIKKDSVVVIPVYGIHHDARYYPNPNKFDPERFTQENKAARNSFTFMPFGNGPRNCIGMRFSLLEVKAVIAHLVYTFHFSPSSKTLIPMEYSTSVSLKPKSSLWLKLSHR